MADLPVQNQNAPENIDLITAKSTMEMYGGLGKSCRYIARILTPPRLVGFYQPAAWRDLMYLCEATELPGRSFNNVDIRYYGPNQKVPFQSVYEDINMTFLCRDQSLERQLFDDWMWIINPTNTFDFTYRDEYATQIDLFSISDIGDGTEVTPTYKFSLIEAFPIMVNPQPVTWADTDFLRLTITFTYNHWRRPNEPESKPFTLVPNAQVDQPSGAGTEIRNRARNGIF